MWEQVSGELVQISCGRANEVWGVNSNDQIYRRKGDKWEKIQGRLVQVSVGDDGEVWGVNRDMDIYRLVDRDWNPVPGRLVRISVGSESQVWGVNENNSIYKYTGDERDPWIQIEGGLTSISVGHDGSVWGTNKNGQIYHYLPDVFWEQEYRSINYHERTPPETRKDLVMERRLGNDSKGATLEQSVTYSRSRTATYEWGMTKNLRTGLKIGFKSKVPFGSMSGEMSVQLDLGSHETWSTSENQELSITDSVSIPAGERVVLKSFYDWADNVVVPFDLHVKISGKSKDITIPEVYKANSLDEIELSGNQIKDIILQSHPDAEIHEVLANAVDLSMPGRFTGSYAINTSTQMEALE